MATGDIRYYEVARNLLLSYRWYSREPLPFAIICEDENEVTAEFDDVILIDNPVHSFLDKLKVPELCPYDETIFIDSDCLAYRDLNGLWRLFSHSGDFSVPGFRYRLDSGRGWLSKDGAGVYKERVRFSMIYQGGIFFMRKGKLDAFSDDCKYILDNFDSFRFPGYPFKGPVDEQIFALASSIHGYEPSRPYERVFCYYPLCRSVDMDISEGRLSYRYNGTFIYPEGRFFLHWSMAEVEGDLYKREVGRLASMISSGKRPGHFWELRNRSLDFFLHIMFYCRSLYIKIVLYLRKVVFRRVIKGR